jgi:hypothetical protein
MFCLISVSIVCSRPNFNCRTGIAANSQIYAGLINIIIRYIGLLFFILIGFSVKKYPKYASGVSLPDIQNAPH